jgi:hypothetical protein
MCLLVASVVPYCGSYIYLSRRGFAAAARSNAEGFWFVRPRSSQSAIASTWNEALVVCYWPLLALDQACGTGRPAAAWPMSGLE